jgi:hypothetical protein
MLVPAVWHYVWTPQTEVHVLHTLLAEQDHSMMRLEPHRALLCADVLAAQTTILQCATVFFRFALATVPTWLRPSSSGGD